MFFEKTLGLFRDRDDAWLDKFESNYKQNLQHR